MYPRPWSLTFFIYSIDRAMMGISRQGVVLDSHPGGSGAETKCAVVAIILRNYNVIHMRVGHPSESDTFNNLHEFYP